MSISHTARRPAAPTFLLSGFDHGCALISSRVAFPAIFSFNANSSGISSPITPLSSPLVPILSPYTMSSALLSSPSAFSHSCKPSVASPISTTSLQCMPIQSPPNPPDPSCPHDSLVWFPFLPCDLFRLCPLPPPPHSPLPAARISQGRLRLHSTNVKSRNFSPPPLTTVQIPSATARTPSPKTIYTIPSPTVHWPMICFIFLIISQVSGSLALVWFGVSACALLISLATALVLKCCRDIDMPAHCSWRNVACSSFPPGCWP